MPDEQLAIVGRLGPAGLGARLAKELADPFLAGGIRSRYQRLTREGYLGGSAALREATARFGRAGSQHDGSGHYLTPSMPVLVCASSEDPSHDAAAEFAETAADGRCFTFDRCQRPLAVHCPEEFADAVYSFFAEIEGVHEHA